MNDTPQTILEAATELYRRGMTPLPMPHRSKDPGFVNWPDFRVESEEDLARYFSSEPMNISFLPGESSGGAVDIDVDRQEAILVAPFFFPPTMCFGRPSKRRSHYIYRPDAVLKTKKYQVPNSGEGRGGMFIELRSTGLQTVVPPSTHESGEPIRYENDLEPASIAAADLERCVQLAAVCALVLCHWPDGQSARQEIALALAGSLLRAGLTEEEAERVIRVAAEQRGDEEADKRAGAVAYTAAKLEGGEAVTGFPRLAELIGEEPVKTLAQWLHYKSAKPAHPWPEPQPLGNELPCVPRMDEADLPTGMRAWARDVAERMQVPLDFTGTAGLQALAGTVLRRLCIRPKQYDDWYVVPNLWGYIVGPPSVKKSDAVAQMMAPLYRRNGEAIEAWREEMKDYEARKTYFDARSREIKKTLAALSDASEARAVLEENSAGEAPTCRRLIVNDPTIEALEGILAENLQGVLVLRDELSGFLVRLRLREYERDRKFYLEAWSGLNSYTSDRIGRGLTHIPVVAVALFGTIQEPVLRSYLAGTLHQGQDDDGLAQRFQLACYPDALTHYTHVDRYPDKVARAEYDELIAYLVALGGDEVGAERDAYRERVPPFLRFDEEAQPVFDVWLTALEGRLRSGALHPALEAHLGKYRSFVPALALIHHVAERKAGPVSLAALESAIRLAAYYETHAMRIYGASTSAAETAGQSLATRLLNGELADGFTARDVYRHCWAGLSNKQETEAALEVLVDAGWVRAEQVSTGGRPSLRYRINPRLAASVSSVELCQEDRHPAKNGNSGLETAFVGSVSFGTGAFAEMQGAAGDGDDVEFIFEEDA